MHRLAIRMGYKSVACMVDEIEPDELDKFLAVEYLDGDDWQRTAWLSMQVRNAALVLAAKSGHAVREDEIKGAVEYLPASLQPPKKQPPPTQDNQSLDHWMRSMARSRRHG